MQAASTRGSASRRSRTCRCEQGENNAAYVFTDNLQEAALLTDTGMRRRPVAFFHRSTITSLTCRRPRCAPGGRSGLRRSRDAARRTTQVRLLQQLV